MKRTMKGSCRQCLPRDKRSVDFSYYRCIYLGYWLAYQRDAHSTATVLCDHKQVFEPL